jgi:hypothetical protein
VELLWELLVVSCQLAEGAVECWSDGVSEWWSIGVVEYWSIGVVEWWSANRSITPILQYSIPPFLHSVIVVYNSASGVHGWADSN